MRETGRSLTPITAGTPIARARIATCDELEPVAETMPTRRSFGTSASWTVGSRCPLLASSMRLAQLKEIVEGTSGEETVTCVVQVAGKVRDRIEDAIPVSSGSEEIEIIVTVNRAR